jgi:presenilin enhancer 2
VKVAKSFYYGGFLLLPLLWFVNCFYFWPVLQHREAEPLIRRCMMMLYAPFLVSHL